LSLEWIGNFFTGIIQPNDVRRAFDSVLDKTRINLYAEEGVITRDMRDWPWTDWFKYYGLGTVGGGKEWYSSKIDCSDYGNPSYVGAKSEIHWAMFYMHKENYHSAENGWLITDKVVVVDANFHGSYRKDVVVDNAIIHSYHPSADDWSGTSAWIHYNTTTGDVLKLG